LEFGFISNGSSLNNLQPPPQNPTLLSRVSCIVRTCNAPYLFEQVTSRPN
jgi:hypothetical protein